MRKSNKEWHIEYYFQVPAELRQLHKNKDYFDDWLEDIYRVEHLQKYLMSKYSGERNQFTLDRVATAFPKVLKR